MNGWSDDSLQYNYNNRKGKMLLIKSPQDTKAL